MNTGDNKQLHIGNVLTSFSMTAIRLPWLFVRILFSKVVLPDPRKPVMTCTMQHNQLSLYKFPELRINGLPHSKA